MNPPITFTKWCQISSYVSVKKAMPKFHENRKYGQKLGFERKTKIEILTKIKIIGRKANILDRNPNCSQKTKFWAKYFEIFKF